MRIGNLNRSKPVVLAPLAGVSNRPFRVLAVKAGAALTYTEMVSSEGVARLQQKTLDYIKFQPDEQPIAVQLFGANPEIMRRAAKITVEKFSPDIIDINLGCPVKKVVLKNGGAAVLKNLRLTMDIIRATVEGAEETPVTVKIRTGWDDATPVYIEVGQIAQQAGAQAVTLHARSRAGGFSGQADWSAIKKLKDSLDIPVIGNGDINSPEDAKRMFDDTGCDAVMIGRAAMKDPTIFTRTSHYLNTGELLPEPSVNDIITLALEHAQLMAEHFGEQRGMKMMRRYLGWYVRGFHAAGDLRQKLFQVNTLFDIHTVFDDYRSRHP